MKRKFLWLVFAGLMLVISSCTSNRRLQYFQDIPQKGEPVDIDMAEFTEPVIRPDDILTINVNVSDPQAAQAINVRNFSGFQNPATAMSPGSTGYLVDKQGNIEIPVLGTVRISGMTTYQAKQHLGKLAAEYYKNPVVDVRFSNFRITVLGEVNRPATYTLQNEQVSILEVIGQAGDLTMYGKRGNVLLIRKDGRGKSKAVRLNLKDKDLMNSPYFYLKQNDVVYVEPSASRSVLAESSWLRYITAAASVASAYVLLIRYTSLGGN